MYTSDQGFLSYVTWCTHSTPKDTWAFMLTLVYQFSEQKYTL